MDFIISHEYAHILLPVVIFLLRIMDVSIGTVRIVFVAKGFKYLAPLIGFFEAVVWVIAISGIMQNLDNWVNYVAYAAGFATGNYIGILLEERIAIGHEIIRVVTKRDATELVDALRSSGFGVTSVEAWGIQGEVAVLFVITGRKKTMSALKLIKTYNPQAFFTIEEVRSVNKQVFHGSIEKPRRFFRGIMK